MLEQLTIKNIALIDYAIIDFTKGLNVLSGETGAGKSVIIDSLNFVLGAKADKTMIKSGCEECGVTACFNVANNLSASNALVELDIETEDTIIISRKFNLDGKSSIKINGVTVTVGMLKKITQILVDVHGQSEHYQLLSTANQLKLIDKLGKTEISKHKEQLKTAFAEYKELINSIDQLGGDEHSRLIRLDLLHYQINEIERADVKPNELENLLECRNVLKNQEKVISALNSIKSALSDDGCVCDMLSTCSKISSSISALGDKYNEIYDKISQIQYDTDDLSELVSDVISQMDGLNMDPNEVEERIETIKNIYKKYGDNHEKVSQFLLDAEKEVNILENYNENTSKLNEKKVELEKIIYSLYNDLSKARRTVAKRFSVNVLNELKELGMPKANFDVCFTSILPFDECKFTSNSGIDEIEFLLSANNGEPLKPLSRVISGGEMSRLMLSIKTQTSDCNELSTYVFDEIDAGISGNVAKVVAEKFAKISKNTQVIAISHLPQISAMADNNLLIEKQEIENGTKTTVKKLNQDEKTYEIVRLIGGNKDSKVAIEHAKDLIEKANYYKNSL